MTLAQKIREAANILNPVIQLERLFNNTAMDFGNWLLKQDYPRLYVKSGLDNSYMRMPMKDILEVYKKEKGL